MHLDASVGVQASGHTISHWWDQSGHGQNLQATGTPTLTDAELNGLPVVELSHAADRLGQSRASSLPALDNDRTLVILSSTSKAAANLGYGGPRCGDTFGLTKDLAGYSALGTGCDNGLMFATGQTHNGEWNLHVLMVRAGTLIHLRDGELVDGRASRLQTMQGPFEIEMQPTTLATAAGGSLKIATVLAYNWSLGSQELERLQRFIGTKWFNNPNHFRVPPDIQNLQLPKPAMQLSRQTTAKEQLELTWRVSFADDCHPNTGWTQTRGTSGKVVIPNPQLGASYGLNCWSRTASANANFADASQLAAATKPVQIHWQQPQNPEGQARGYRLFVGERSQSYSKVLQIPVNPTNSHTLQLPPGQYFVAMSTIDARGMQSSLSTEIRFRVD